MLQQLNITLIFKDMKTNYSNSADIHNIAKQRKQQGPLSQGWQSSSSFAAGIFSLLVQSQKEKTGN